MAPGAKSPHTLRTLPTAARGQSAPAGGMVRRAEPRPWLAVQVPSASESVSRPNDQK